MRGFTLVETAISGVVVAGITASLLLAVRYAQMVNQGKAVGEQLTTISTGANRYMKKYSKEILALDRSCADAALVLGDGAGTSPSDQSERTVDCKLVLGDVTIANGYQPTVDELRRLELVRANDQLMLPFSPGIAVDKATGEAAIARIAIWIRPVSDTPSTGGAATPAQASLMKAAALTGASPGTSSLARPLDLPPSLNGVSCYNGEVSKDKKEFKGGDWVIADAKDEKKILPIFDPAEIRAHIAANRGNSSVFFHGSHYCDYMRQQYGQGVFGPAPGTPGGGTGPSPGTGGSNTWTLESVVFNTQPYYFGGVSLPIGAAAQIGAALEQAGYAGRLSTLKSSPTDSRIMQGVYGHAKSDNPIRSKDGREGVPGILAAVNLLGEDGGAVSDSGGGPGGNGNWDAAGHNIVNAALIQAEQIAGQTAVVGSGSALSTRGRDVVMSVNGNMVMGEKSVMIANQLEAIGLQANKISTPQLDTSLLNVTGAALLLGKPNKSGPFDLYLRDGTRFRLPRAVPGELCEGLSDLAMSQTVSIQKSPGNPVLLTRFVLFCEPEHRDDFAGVGSVGVYTTSRWTSAEYKALRAKYPAPTYYWSWFNSTQSDMNNL
ncbi:hypothetical protein OU995_17260 [Roseateles sp. SL47]|uniref:hypothetical protein n=1 Tax=Roseateles sp. SL47 TaxID=2995138 RepID=UPI00226F4C5B|nr:hypothetical protein [Roseateles sp. SL47]WAC71331.1 hypothetical protein OU995_17260 [Roseateles sp. SL47]